ncbi:hypothetical protein SS50377_23282 [Spironucleus salmonicida]|uniref:Uncharacterized protein n=1 Tax=Spironucleus salmonicida TaxID=348837 RepID=V6LRC4_9EUKA|nr:hypothetical protein SS50377_23282 [Spironucleus salmonicida]|eukprot:EST47150.1 Hypothetical protein SS50377_12661 [Spironucleus salmonicida]
MPELNFQSHRKIITQSFIKQLNKAKIELKQPLSTLSSAERQIFYKYFTQQFKQAAFNAFDATEHFTKKNVFYADQDLQTNESISHNDPYFQEKIEQKFIIFFEKQTQIQQQLERISQKRREIQILIDIKNEFAEKSKLNYQAIPKDETKQVITQMKLLQNKINEIQNLFDK